MQYMILCTDRPDALELRKANRAAHLKYIADAGDKILLAGPCLSDGDAPHPIGSLLVIEAASMTAAELFAKNDPYARAGVFESAKISPFKPVLGVWPNPQNGG